MVKFSKLQIPLTLANPDINSDNLCSYGASWLVSQRQYTPTTFMKETHYNVGVFVWF